MSYDADLIVIGAGPAGMAAAIRARWVKTAQMAPASVLLLDPHGCGGIAEMGAIFLTGPSFGFAGPDLVAHLIKDVEAMEIPVVRETAVNLEHEGPYWIVQTPHRTLRSLAVVVAVGLRRLANEVEVLKAGGLNFMSGGYTRAGERFTYWSRTNTGKQLVIIGSEALADTLPLFLEHDNGRNTITALCEPRQQVQGYNMTGGRVWLKYTEGGMEQALQCDKVMLDYHSLQLTPPSPAFLPAAMRAADGYCSISQQGDSDFPGLFGAGDCIGPPSASLKAMSNGSEAGFNAYRYIFEHKFDVAPHLFAFYVSPERPPLVCSEVPAVDPHIHHPVGLTAASRFPSIWALSHTEHATPTTLSGDDLAALQVEIEKKIATVHRRMG